ncbi:hypothetical protein [Streptomyces shenzhenensis]|uniref:hypothetical protein n=1 Tax=Streptomyces shenzhenensis TaxID=943815 RepID=UPI0036C384F5
MPITHQEIGRRFAPPRTGGEHYARKLALSDLAMQLADEVLALVPGSREQSRSIEGLESCVHWAHAGIDRRLDRCLDASDALDGALGPGRGGRAVGLPSASEEVGTAVWVPGVTHSGLPPTHRLVALVLAAHADPATGRIAEDANPTLPELRERTGLALHDLHAVLRDLDRLGWIGREHTRQGDTHRARYRLHLPRPVRGAPPCPAAGRETGRP